VLVSNAEGTERKAGGELPAAGSARGEGPELGAPAPRCGLARLGNVTGLRPFRTVDDLELDPLAFFQRPEPGALNSGEGHEPVFAPLALDETVALRVVEPLDLARDAHRTCLPCKKRGGVHRVAPRRRSVASAKGYKKRPRVRSQLRRWPAQ